MTDKVNAEVPAEVGGVVTSILVEDGQTVKVGTPLAEISEDGEAAAAPAPAAAGAATIAGEVELEAPLRDGGAARTGRPDSAHGAAAPEPEPLVAGPAAGAAARATCSRPRTEAQAPPLLPEPPAKLQRRHLAGEAGMRMTPAVRRLVREHNLDVTQIPGTGAGGRVTRDDVLAFVAATAASTPAPATEPVTGSRSGSTAAPAPEAAPARSIGCRDRHRRRRLRTPDRGPAAAPTPATAPAPSCSTCPGRTGSPAPPSAAPPSAAPYAAPTPRRFRPPPAATWSGR